MSPTATTPGAASGGAPDALVPPSGSPAPTHEPASPVRGSWRTDASILAVVAIAIRLPAYLASAHLGFDDAVYGASAVAMRRGGLPFRDVFSSQGPLHLPLVWAGDLIGGRTASSPRLTAVLAGAVATVAVYVAARRLASRAGALLAGILVALSGCVLWTTGPITADGPAIALAATAVALSVRYRDRPSRGLALAVGAVLGAALSVKAPLVLLSTIPVAGFLLSARRVRDLSAAACSALAVGLASTLPWGFGRVWDQSVAYQIDSDRNGSMRDNAEKILSTLWDRDPLLLAVAAVAVAYAVARRSVARRGAKPGTGLVAPIPAAGTRWSSPLPRVRDAHLIWAWLLALLLFLVIEPAMWRNHIAHLVAPLALLATLRPPPMRLVAVAAVVALPFQLARLDGVLHPDPYRGDEAAAVDALRALPGGAWAISDDPGFVWRAGRDTPFDLVDTSVKRVQQGRITTKSVVDAASDPRVCAVLVWSDRRFGALEGLASGLAAGGYSETLRFDEDRALYERSPCN